MDKVNMTSLVTVMAAVEKMGFTSQFEVNAYGLYSFKSEQTFNPEEIKIEHFYRFEGESNPDDSAILYAIVTDSGEKGTLVDGYGTQADAATGAFIKRVQDINK
ncbi:MAG: hypothetical protein PSV16_07205 [Flavobacterium sp.]|nr:hypothetical protein [Flavobacterium sp.]